MTTIYGEGYVTDIGKFSPDAPRRKTSPYENVTAVLLALYSHDHMTRAQIREAIGAGSDDHQAIRIWRWLISSGFAELLPKRGRAERIRLAPMWRGPDPTVDAAWSTSLTEGGK